jgi:hypothetical protein
MKSAPPHSFGRVTYALAAVVFAGFALASLQGASCLSIDQNVCVAADGSGDCNGSGTPGTRTAQTVPDEVFESPFGEDDTCESQYDCYEGNELDQCLRPACVAGRCVAVVNSFQACTPYGLWCAIGECMPMPNTSIYPAYCSFNPNFEEYTGGPQIVPNSCLLGQQCYAGGDPNPLDACQVCEPDPNSRSPGLWAPKQCEAGKTCSNGTCVECVTADTCTNTPSSACMKRACIAGVCGEEPDLGKVCTDDNGPDCVVARCIPGTEANSVVCESNVVALNTYFTSGGAATPAGDPNILTANNCLVGATSGADGTCVAVDGRKPGNDCYFCSPGASPPTYGAGALAGAAFNWTAQGIDPPTACDAGTVAASGTCVAGTLPETDAVVCQANP